MRSPLSTSQPHMSRNMKITHADGRSCDYDERFTLSLANTYNTLQNMYRMLVKKERSGLGVGRIDFHRTLISEMNTKPKIGVLVVERSVQAGG